MIRRALSRVQGFWVFLEIYSTYLSSVPEKSLKRAFSVFSAFILLFVLFDSS